MNLKDNERLVDKSMLIAEHAAVVCNYAQEPGLSRDQWLKEYIHFDDAHRVIEGKFGLAHDKDCKPIENIGRFRECYAPQYKLALDAIINVSEKELEENKAASLRSLLGYKKCLGRYLAQWFDADDKLKVETYTSECDALLDDISLIKSEFLWFVAEVYVIIGKVSPYGTKPPDYNKELHEPMEAHIDNIRDVIIPEINELSDYIMPLEEDFSQAESNIKSLNTKLGTIKSIMDKMKGLLDKFSRTGELSRLESTKKLIDNARVKITDIQKNITDWVLVPCNLITTKSYLVCKCGGILSFYDNGQSYDDMCDQIVQATEDLFEFMKQQSNDWYNGWDEYQTDSSDLASNTHREKELRNSKQAVKITENLKEATSTNTNPEMKSIDDARNAIHLEFWSHAYFEEGESFATGILSILSMFMGGMNYLLSMSLLFYQFTKEDKNRPLEWEDAGSVADILSPFYDIDFISKASGLLGAYSAITSLFYTSNDTWTEEIRTTFFTDDYAVIGRQKIKEDGTKNGNPKFEKIDYFYYMESPYSDGIKWKLDGVKGEEYDTYLAES